MFIASGYETLITALYFKCDPYLKSYVCAPPSHLSLSLTSLVETATPFSV
jgi:hypothetical protein